MSQQEIHVRTLNNENIGLQDPCKVAAAQAILGVLTDPTQVEFVPKLPGGLVMDDPRVTVVGDVLVFDSSYLNPALAQMYKAMDEFQRQKRELNPEKDPNDEKKSKLRPRYRKLGRKQ